MDTAPKFTDALPFFVLTIRVAVAASLFRKSRSLSSCREARREDSSATTQDAPRHTACVEPMGPRTCALYWAMLTVIIMTVIIANIWPEGVEAATLSHPVDRTTP